MHYFFINIIQLALSIMLINRKNKHIWYILASFMGAFIVTKLMVPDYQSYKDTYDLIPSISFDLIGGDDQQFNSLYGEKLYLLTGSLFKTFGFNFDGFRFAIIFFILIVNLKIIEKLSPFLALSIYIYFVFFFYTDSYIIRQSIAASITSIAILFVLKGRLYFAFSLILFASGFHVVSLLALPLVFFNKFKMSIKVALLMLLLIFCVGYIGVTNLLLPLLNGLNFYATEKLIRYSLSEFGEPLGLLRGSVLIFTFFSLFYIFSAREIKKHFVNYDYFLNCMLYSFVFLVGFNDFGVFGERTFRFFPIIFPIVISSCFYAFNKQNKLLVLPFAFILLTILSMLLHNTDRVYFM
ncbi:EpsG family protein [Shewanella sp. WPAGA9]|uniref:EpsG family protein n=1 Tax=Shewanella sp. ENK2 TaxID=2775245 RepID=UPI00177E91E5|nr:EpsG family protein [Shewanella sp. WPAGA9]